MSYRFDAYDNSLIIDGWEKGVADSPFSGIADMRNVNAISVPGEASVLFATQKISSPIIGGPIFPSDIVVTGLSSNTISFTGQTGLENGMAIAFSSVGGLTGVTVGTTYWIGNSSGSPTTSFKLYSDFSGNNVVTIGGSSTSSPTFSVYTVGANRSTTGGPKDFCYVNVPGYACYFMVDGLGQVWTNYQTTASGFWKFTGSTGNTETSATTISYFADAQNNVYVILFRQYSIDYFKMATLTWTWGWNPSTGGTNDSSTYLVTTNIRKALFAVDRTLYFCDVSNVRTIFQTNASIAFNPTDTTTYTYSAYALLPTWDQAQCLTLLGSSMLIGARSNIIYVWDRSSPLPSNYLFVAEANCSQIVTVNTNAYALMGNRGRVYYTNGTNVSLYKKVPDHISGTIEPYFIWGGIATIKNQLYFSVKGTTNSGTAINQYGAVWAVDLDTDAMRLVNQLSYGTYAGYAPALIGNYTSNPNGAGLYIGWEDGSFHYGIDGTVSTPYTGGQATIDTDLIPIGTFNKPRDFTQLEYRLTRPIVSGESITIKTRLIFNTANTGYSTGWTDVYESSNPNKISNSTSIDFKNAQWVQFQIVLTSTASNPSYVRLKEIRVLGLK